MVFLYISFIGFRTNEIEWFSSIFRKIAASVLFLCTIVAETATWIRVSCYRSAGLKVLKGRQRLAGFRG